MNDEQMKELTEQMKLLVSGLITGFANDLKEELRAEQKAACEAIKTEVFGAVTEVSKKVSELEKTLSGTSFVNKVFEDSISSYNLFPTSVAATTTTSIVTTTASSPISSNIPMGMANSTSLTTAQAVPLTNSIVRSIHSHGINIANSSISHHSSPVAPLDMPAPLAGFSPIVGSSIRPGGVPCGAHSNCDNDQIFSSAPTQTTSGNLTCNLTPFDGTVSWSDYRIQFEIIARNNNWNEQEKADAIVTQLRGNDLSVLSVFPHGHRIQYDELVSLLEQRFGMDPYSCQVQFHGRIQGVKESFANFTLELQRLAIAAFPS